MQQRQIMYLIIVFMAVIGQFATELYLPSIPAMALAFNVPINVIQLTITIYVLGFGIGSLLYGTLSDMFGRKPMMLACVIIGLVGSLICCFSFKIDWLYGGRFIQGLGFSGAAVIARSITKDISSNETDLAKLSSTIAIMYSMALAFAPVVGGYIQQYTFWRLNFILLLVMAVIALVVCWRKMYETNINKRHLTIKTIVLDYFEVLTNPQFLMYNAISALTLGGMLAYQTISPLLLQVRVGLTPDKFGYTVLIIVGALMLGNFINSRIMPRRGMLKMINLGCWLYIVAGVTFIITGIFDWVNVYIILGSMVLYVIGAGMVYPNCSSGAMGVFGTKSGTTASIYNSLQMIGAVVGSGLISIHVHANQLYLGIMLACIGGICIVCGRKLHIKTMVQIAKV